MKLPSRGRRSRTVCGRSSVSSGWMFWWHRGSKWCLKSGRVVESVSFRSPCTRRKESGAPRLARDASSFASAPLSSASEICQPASADTLCDARDSPSTRRLEDVAARRPAFRTSLWTSAWTSAPWATRCPSSSSQPSR